MPTITIQITAPLAAFAEYADDLGYVSEIVSEPGLDPIPNPESKQAFLERRLKEQTVELLLSRKAANIQREINEAKEVQKRTVRTAIENAVVVTSK
jgi:hypothetical protein